MTAGAAEPLRPIEVATSVVFGRAQGESADPGSASTPLEALERAILPALQRPPCLVTFSGGLDSSAVLAVAANVARRHGLEAPVPVTTRFREAEDADETEWQELVIAHVGLDDWERVEVDDELDIVGPVAMGAMRRHGLLWPFNAHFFVPSLEAARGGSLLTGFGGDEMFGVTRWARANAVLARTTRPRPRDALAIGLALAPQAVRRRVFARRQSVVFPWLTRGGQAELTAWIAALEASEPRLYRDRPRWWQGLRMTTVVRRSLGLLADDTGTLIAHPLAEPELAAALVRIAPGGGPVDRGRFLRCAIGDLLPASLYERRSKARFDRAFWNRHAREAATRWTGDGVDTTVVDADALRAEWSSFPPAANSFTQLQAVQLRELTDASRRASP